MKLAVVGATLRVPGLPARLRALAVRLGEKLGKPHCSASLLLTDGAGIRDLNARFRAKDEPTDVLFFPSGTEDAGVRGHHLGDLAISLETAEVQAAEQGHGVTEEAEILLLHGVLHLLGHDHETDRGEMRELESRLAREFLGAKRGLTGRSGGP